MIETTIRNYRFLMELTEDYPSFRFDGWVRKKSSLDFIKALEEAIDPTFNGEAFDTFAKTTKNITPNLLKKFGCKSVITKPGGWTLIHDILFISIQKDLDPYFSLNIAQTVLSKYDLKDIFPMKNRFENTLRNIRVLNYIRVLEQAINKNFDIDCFDKIVSHNTKISVKELYKANVLSIKSTAGRYGGTYIHRSLLAFILAEKDPKVFFDLYFNNPIQYRFKNILSEGFIYIIKYSDTIYKIGKSRFPVRMFNCLKNKTNLDLNLIKTFSINKDLSKIEKQLHLKYKSEGLKAIDLCKDQHWFNKDKELFYFREEDIPNVISFIDSLSVAHDKLVIDDIKRLDLFDSVPVIVGKKQRLLGAGK